MINFKRLVLYGLPKGKFSGFSKIEKTLISIPNPLCTERNCFTIVDSILTEVVVPPAKANYVSADFEKDMPNSNTIPIFVVVL